MQSVVTIDGPAGSGKSTIAKLVAERLGWELLDTGAMYRALAWRALQEDLDAEDETAMGTLAGRTHLEFAPGQILVNGEDATSAIRTVEVTKLVRFVANHPSVRRQLVAWQQEFASTRNTVTEGRDQGTIVFPGAACKFFLTADPAERARRRHAEFVQRGESITFEQVLADLRRRDAEDEERAIAPLKPAEDAIGIDSSGMTIDAVVDQIVTIVESRLAR